MEKDDNLSRTPYNEKRQRHGYWVICDWKYNVKCEGNYINDDEYGFWYEDKDEIFYAR